MKVKIEFMETSTALELEAENTYTKGPLFCVFGIDGRVQKFPVDHIFRVVEDYTSATR